MSRTLTLLALLVIAIGCGKKDEKTYYDDHDVRVYTSGGHAYIDISGFLFELNSPVAPNLTLLCTEGVSGQGVKDGDVIIELGLVDRDGVGVACLYISAEGEELKTMLGVEGIHPLYEVIRLSLNAYQSTNPLVGSI